MQVRRCTGAKCTARTGCDVTEDTAGKGATATGRVRLSRTALPSRRGVWQRKRGALPRSPLSHFRVRRPAQSRADRRCRRDSDLDAIDARLERDCRATHGYRLRSHFPNRDGFACRRRGLANLACFGKAISGRSGVIRTLDPLVPNEVRYQAALHSVTSGVRIEQAFPFHKRKKTKKCNADHRPQDGAGADAGDRRNFAAGGAFLAPCNRSSTIS